MMEIDTTGLFKYYYILKDGSAKIPASLRRISVEGKTLCERRIWRDGLDDNCEYVMVWWGKHQLMTLL